jgi:hypothetical protein
MTTLEKLNPVIEIASQMLLGGTLKKNVKRNLINKGFPEGAADNIIEMAVIRAENFTKGRLK